MLRKFALVLTAGCAGMLAWRRLRQVDLRGKSVLIAGSSRGLGLELARAFSRRGARLALLARDPAELATAVDEVRRVGGDAISVVCDITDEESLTGAIDEVADRMAGLDVLVNNAGIILVGPLANMKTDDFRAAMDVHFFGPLVATLKARPYLEASTVGRVVNIASVAGRFPAPHLLPYVASKFALVGLSEGLRVELSEAGIPVTTVLPGLLRTGSPVNAEFRGHHRKEHAWFSIAASLPLVSKDSRRAADEIVVACARGVPELYITPQARLGAVVAGLFPGLTARVLSVVNRALPGATQEGDATLHGRESRSGRIPRWLTRLSDAAAERNNQLVAILERKGR